MLLSRFSRVRLCATPEMAAHQASPSLGFSRQEHWSGLPFPSTMHESEKGKWNRSMVSDSLQSHGLQPTSSSIHGIFQARVLEWVAIAFSALPLSHPENPLLTHTIIFIENLLDPMPVWVPKVTKMSKYVFYCPAAPRLREEINN